MTHTMSRVCAVLFRLDLPSSTAAKVTASPSEVREPSLVKKLKRASPPLPPSVSSSIPISFVHERNHSFFCIVAFFIHSISFHFISFYFISFHICMRTYMPNLAISAAMQTLGETLPCLIQTGESFLLMFASRVSNIKQLGARAGRVKILEKRRGGSPSPPPLRIPFPSPLPPRRIASPYLVL